MSRVTYAHELGISGGRAVAFAALFSRIFWRIRAARWFGEASGALVQATILFRCDLGLRTELSVGSSGWMRGAFDQQLGDLHEIVGEHRGTNKQFEVRKTLEAPMPQAYCVFCDRN